jgi:hypothetical protein
MKGVDGVDTREDIRNERLIAASLLLLGFLLGWPAVVIGAPNLGETSDVGRALPFLFDPVWEKYWYTAFLVVTLYGLVILEGVLRRAGDHIFSRLGLVTFTLATVMFLLMVVFEKNYLPSGAGDVEAYFIALAFPAVIAYGLAILRTGILARWIGVAVVLWTAVMLVRVFPGNRGPLFYEPALVLIAVALVVSRRRDSSSPSDR